MSESLLQTLKHLPIGIGLFRAIRKRRAVVDFINVWKNPAFVAAVGFDTPPGVTHFELFPDAHSTVVAKRFLQTIQAVLKNGRQETFETYSPSPTQSYLFEISDAGVDDHFFLLLRHVPDGSCDDRQMHQLLKEQAFLFQSECIGYWKSVSRVFSWTNATFDRMLGYRRHELLGKSTRLIYSSEEAFKAIGQQMNDRNQAESGIHLEIPFVRKDGQQGWFEVAFRQTSDDGETAWIGSCIDRSAEHASALALKKSEQRLATCLKGSGAAYFDWDLVTGKIEFDRAAFSALGIAPTDSFDALLAITHRNDKDIIRRYIDSHMDRDVAGDSCEFRIRHTEGHWISVLLCGSVVEFDEPTGNIPVRLAGTVTDVTTNKRIERETEQLLHRLEHLIKERISPYDQSISNASPASMIKALSRRQIEVLHLIAAGLTSIEIAERLHISEATVHSHRKELMQKLGQKNVATLTRFAIESGIL